ncbi:uncharacterized protein LOC132033845 [Lycium ferocissimum]|uniref:uncharacterized protein LOC132033845 n=1 Tax=Lycium ferocissimum TaxID=112874 RepID=UPI002815C3C3|nr:uncharacterized protein LOC132033845 [Lycium ferocissimum]
MASTNMENHIEKILFTEQQISQKVSELASQITLNFTPTKIISNTNNEGALLSSSLSAPVIVGVATGAFLFLADLVREIKLPISVDFVRVESYGSGIVSSGKPKISCDLKIDVTGKHVILVEDIVDTGNTLSCLIAHLKSKGASSISVCTLLDKPSKRKVNFELVGEGKFYRGFECPDYFVVGYGLDFAELYRNLPYVGVLKPEMYS